jgi:hypothetical protein
MIGKHRRLWSDRALRRDLGELQTEPGRHRLHIHTWEIVSTGQPVHADICGVVRCAGCDDTHVLPHRWAEIASWPGNGCRLMECQTCLHTRTSWITAEPDLSA